MKKRLILACASGILLIFAFAPFRQGYLAWWALVPLLVALDADNSTLKERAIVAFVGGFAFFLGSVYWVIHSMYFYGGVPLYISVGAMIALAAYMAVYIGIFGVASRYTLTAPPVLRVLLTAAAWTCLEYIRGYLFTGFPWSLIGYTQSAYLPIIQMADVTGVWGLSFLIIAVNTAAYLFIKSALNKDIKRPATEVIIVMALYAIAFGYGTLRIDQTSARFKDWNAIRASIAQGSIDQAIKWSPAYRDETIDIYRKLSLEAAGKKPYLIVWPENAMPFFLGAKDEATANVASIVKSTGANIFTGAPGTDLDATTKKRKYFNSAFLFRPDGSIAGRYDKTHLVPFGEYAPLIKYLPFMRSLTPGMEDFTEGPGAIPIPFTHGKIGVLICYEAIFPEIAQLHTKNGATIMVNITNDGWFGTTSAPHQHLEITQLRAVENKISVIRAANTGISAFIDPLGRISSSAGLFEKKVLTDWVMVRSGPMTFYSEHGDVFTYACFVFVAVYFAYFIYNAIRRKRDVRGS